jgi:hypothetical protein
MATPERYEGATDPLYWYLGSIIAVLVLVGVATIFWLAAHPKPTSAALPGQAVGTSGYSTEGGHDPDPRPRNTRDELKFRGF